MAVLSFAFRSLPQRFNILYESKQTHIQENCAIYYIGAVDYRHGVTIGMLVSVKLKISSEVLHQKVQMKIRSETYPDRIRRIADELSNIRNERKVGDVVQKLRKIANELERILKAGPRN